MLSFLWFFFFLFFIVAHFCLRQGAVQKKVTFLLVAERQERRNRYLHGFPNKTILGFFILFWWIISVFSGFWSLSAKQCFARIFCQEKRWLILSSLTVFIQKAGDSNQFQCHLHLPIILQTPGANCSPQALAVSWLHHGTFLAIAYLWVIVYLWKIN